MTQRMDEPDDALAGVSAQRVYAPMTAWRPISAFAATVVIFAAAMAFSRLALLGLEALTGAGTPGARSPGDMEAERTLVTTVMLGAFQLALVVLTLSVASRFAASAYRALSLEPPVPDARAYAQWGTVLIILSGIAAAVMWTFQRDVMISDLRTFDDLLAARNGWILLPVVSIGAAISEELLFRGFLFPALANSRLGLIGAALVSSALWAIVHFQYSVFGLLEVFLLGLFLTLALVKTGSLRVPIFCHALNNLLISAVLMGVELPA